MLVTMKCDVTLTEAATEKVLFHTDNFLFRNEYEISTDVKSFFEEQDPALDRMAQDFAKTPGCGRDGELLMPPVNPDELIARFEKREASPCDSSAWARAISTR